MSAIGHSGVTSRVQILELLAAALDIRPEYFAEYRLAVLRRSLDERAVGFDAACRRHSELTS